MSANNKTKVLIIEDNDIISRLWQITLQAEGFHVDTALSGKEGIEKACSAKPSIILLDLVMPDMDGFQIFHELRKGETSAIPIVILTNVTESEEMAKARSLGAVDFIIKSTILPEQLVSKIRYILAKG